MRDDTLDLVLVFTAREAVAVAVARAVLESAGIPFVTKGEGVQDLLGVGRFPGGYNIATGPVQFLVALPDAEEARALLVADPRSDPS